MITFSFRVQFIVAGDAICEALMNIEDTSGSLCMLSMPCSLIILSRLQLHWCPEPVTSPFTSSSLSSLETYGLCHIVKYCLAHKISFFSFLSSPVTCLTTIGMVVIFLTPFIHSVVGISTSTRAAHCPLYGTKAEKKTRPYAPSSDPGHPCHKASFYSQVFYLRAYFFISIKTHLN
jgi:hypothetical protein